jgi:ligand-binding sensor domain-containing protein/signal transduction histidine kinase
METVIAKRLHFVLLILATMIILPRQLGAERLAVHTYTVADGLAGDQVTVIVQDRQGFLWIGTRTGLSRFDGVGFRSFGTGDGLPHAGIYSILEGSDGTLWFGTGSGLVRLRAERDNTGSAFETVAGIPHGVGALAEDTLGSVWATSRGRLYRGSPSDALEFAEVDAGIAQPPGAARSIGSLVADPDGGLWLGSRFGLFRRLADGTIVRYQSADQSQDLRNNSLFLDSTGRLWVGGDGIVVFKPATVSSLLDLDHKGTRWLEIEDGAPLPETPGRAVRRRIQHPLGAGRIFGLDQGPDGAVWAASHWGAGIIRDRSTATHGRYTGLVSDHLSSVLVDDVGNVWVGTQSHGLMRINSSGFTSYTEAEGLVDRQTSSVTTGPNGEIVVVGLPPEGTIHLRDGDRFLPLEIPLPDDVPRHGWGLNYVSFFDHKGQLWVPTPRGLFRFPHLDDLRDLPRTRHERRYLPKEEIYRLWEDSRGDLWLGVFGEIRLMRWERSTDTIHHYLADDDISHHTGTAFAEDHSGAVWIGFYGGGLARWRGGAFDSFDEADGLPRGLVNSIHIDHRGRLWVGAHSGGLAMTEDPTAETPVWTRTTTADGLTSDGVFSLAEDRFGRIFAGSLKGVDRLDPQTGRIDHFDTSTGLVNNLVLDALTGPEGDLWFATDGGVSRYRPVAESLRSVPAVFIDRLTIDGSDLTVPLHGVVAIPSISLPSHTEVVDIGFAAVDLTPGSRLEFEFTVDSQTEIWSSTHGNRFVRLAGLAPGRRSIAIRARLPDGSVGPAATIDLEIATPLWRRWWFLASVVAVFAIGAWFIQRLRIQRLKELHRVRSRIAADLHDEMGLSLARVAILADVAGRSNGDTTTAETLREIGGTARDLVDATSDMVWALDPRHDTMAALVARLRRQAGEVAEGFGTRFELEADPLDGVPMASEARRHLFLILKEAIRNACRHGSPDNLRLRIKRQASRLIITIEDDGVGFDTEMPRDGQGLASMERRAAEMGAELAIDSTPGHGSTIHLDIPLTSHA